MRDTPGDPGAEVPRRAADGSHEGRSRGNAATRTRADAGPAMRGPVGSPACRRRPASRDRPRPRRTTMTAYIIRRMWQMIPTMLGVILLVFLLFNWVGGDPAYVLAGKISNQEQIDNIRRQLGVDQPPWVQLWIFVKQVLTGDFGASWSTNEKVSQILATRLGPSLTVLVPLLIVETLVAIGLALAVAYVRGSLTDRLVMIVATVGLSISILVYIIVFQYVFAYKLGWFPVQGWGNTFAENLLTYSLLPILIGLVVSIAPNLRLYRTFFLDEINQDYVRTARAKGLSENRIMWVHVLRNASIPIITHQMAALPGLLRGAFLIERFFSIPGIGREVILAVERSDFPVIKAIAVYVAFATMATNLLADLMYKAVDPRVQLK
jgi:peptide/nickel transport system permease protein